MRLLKLNCLRKTNNLEMSNKTFFISTLLMSILHTIMYSQGEVVPSEKKWSFGISISGDYCYRTLGGSYGLEFKKFRDSVDVNRWNGSFGIIASRKKWRNFHLQTGLIFSQKGFNSKPYVVKEKVGKFPTWSTEIDTVKDEFTFGYLSLPLLIKYNFGKSRLKFTASTGVLYDFLIYPNGDHNKGHLTYDYSWGYGRSLVYHSALMNQNISLTFKCGTQIEFNKKYSFAIEGNITHNIPIQKLQLYSFGITGILYVK
ncbi:MAG: outer membrane beta-barrel protein [Bacteroidia bacterium]|nr:outer membrane beta-barrel protein [Bacteroidia bacterium]